MAAVGAFAGPFYGINIAIGSLFSGWFALRLFCSGKAGCGRVLCGKRPLAQGQAGADTPKDLLPFATAIAAATLGWFLYSPTSGA